ncbi:MAG: hypothetical protein JOY99_01040 [Sphingomonadaceae bacterium]|nr:hypothetical protein [Sphingomonadaceae bacterium]
MRERFGRLGIELRSRARDQARWLIRDHGQDAEAVLLEKLERRRISREDRYRYRQTLIELRRLRREEAERARRQALVIWKPPIFTFAGIGVRLGLAKAARAKARRRDD